MRVAPGDHAFPGTHCVIDVLRGFHGQNNVLFDVLHCLNIRLRTVCWCSGSAAAQVCLDVLGQADFYTFAVLPYWERV